VSSLVAILIDALAFGAIYGMVAVGFSIVLRASRVAQFGAGFIALLGAAVFADVLAGLPLWIRLVLCVLFGAVLGMVFYLVVIGIGRRLGASDVQLSLACLAGGLLIGAIVDWTHSGGFFAAAPFVSGHFAIGSSVVLYNEVVTAAVGLAVLALVYVIVARTMLGKAMTAAAKAPDVADVSGLQTFRVVMVAWVLAGSLFMLAGALFGVLAPASSTAAFPLAIKGFAGAVIGGVDSPAGAALGAILLSILDVVFIRYVNASYDDLFIFALLFVLLAIRPEGLRRGAAGRIA
jgi:branched-chain amino acid transport system permease protein